MEDAVSAAQERTRSREIFALVYSVFVAGLCSIVYELLIATTVSYFLGDSVKYFSLPSASTWRRWVSVRTVRSTQLQTLYVRLSARKSYSDCWVALAFRSSI